MVVKNEDQWVYFAIRSVLPYVEQFLITDTGSTDATIKIINSIKSPKIKFSQTLATKPDEITAVRQHQLDITKTPWIWIVDADEIYPHQLAQECLNYTKHDSLEGIVVRRYDLLGDIYHRQLESVGQYQLFGYSGHLLVRLVNQQNIKGLHYQGDYPNEGFFAGDGQSILGRDKSSWRFTTHSLYHAMYLQRSSLGSNLPMFNRSKYKIETGLKLDSQYPAVFGLKRPPHIPDPLAPRSLSYELLASIITPIKNLKRRLL